MYLQIKEKTINLGCQETYAGHKKENTQLLTVKLSNI